jgi:hypothetical protein
MTTTPATKAQPGRRAVRGRRSDGDRALMAEGDLAPAASRAPSRDRGKHAARTEPRPLGARLAWPDVLRAVQGDEARSRLLGLYRAAGFTPDDFGGGGSRGNRAAREALSDALVRTEDMLEGRHGRLAADERARVRALRRRLEGELWP